MARRRSYRSRRSYRPVRRAGRRSSYGRSARRGRRSSGGRTVRIVIEQPGMSSLGRLVPGVAPDGQMLMVGGKPKQAKF